MTNNLKKHKLLIILLLILSSCHPEKNYVDWAHEDMFTFAKQVKQEENLKLIGYGGALMDNVNTISLSFSGKQQLNLEESRILFIKLTEKFLEKVNSNEKIRPYLANYPFKPKNLDFAIYFPCYSPEYSLEEPKYITTVSMEDTYNYDNHRPIEVMYTVIYQNCESSKIVHIETYEKALELATKNCNSN